MKYGKETRVPSHFVTFKYFKFTARSEEESSGRESQLDPGHSVGLSLSRTFLIEPALSISHANESLSLLSPRVMKNGRHNMQISSQRIKVHQVRGGIPIPISDGESEW